MSINLLWNNLLSGMALSSFFTDFIKAGFGGGGLFGGSFNESDFPGFQLFTDSNYQFFNQAFAKNEVTTIYCGQAT